LEVREADDEVTMLITARGDVAEVFRPHARYDFATTGPVPGFLVDEVPAASRELAAAGAELIGEPGAWRAHAWQHFRAPDGLGYEVTSRPFDPDAPRLGIAWAGARSADADRMAAFCERVLGMERTGEEAAMIHFRMAIGDRFEVFRADDPAHAFMDTGPVVAWEVADLDAAQARLSAFRAEVFMGGVRTNGADRWIHVGAPDGCVHSLFERGA
jgi:hypothetical protein